MTDPSKSKSRTYTALPSQPLADSDIHVWCVSLNVSPQDLSYYRSILSKDEVERAMRFVFEKDRNHYITGRGLLRSILGSYLRTDPTQIGFVYGQYGKPALKTGQDYKTLEFNLSHSKDLVVYAFTWNRQLGVDVEYVKPMPDMDDFSERYYSARETVFLNSLAGAQKESVFFKLWTSKEAFLKANGSGLTEPLNEVEVSLETWKSFVLNTVGKVKTQTERWHLEMFNPAPGYQAALVVEGCEGQIVFNYLDRKRE